MVRQVTLLFLTLVTADQSLLYYVSVVEINQHCLLRLSFEFLSGFWSKDFAATCSNFIFFRCLTSSNGCLRFVINDGYETLRTF